MALNGSVRAVIESDAKSRITYPRGFIASRDTRKMQPDHSSTFRRDSRPQKTVIHAYQKLEALVGIQRRLFSHTNLLESTHITVANRRGDSCGLDFAQNRRIAGQEDAAGSCFKLSR
jgi:hypothetical protein